jgi:dTDP-4-amino-4,6-dideoxygalactose transaminase
MFQPLLPLDRMSMDRGEFIARMKDLGIGVGVHYPAMHLFTLFREMGFQPGDFPVAEDIGRRTITLPLFPAMGDADVERVCAAVSSVLSV